METIACPDCDLLVQVPELPPGGKASCPRCANTLATQPTDSLDRTLALTLTAAHSRALARLSQDIAAAVRALDQ